MTHNPEHRPPVIVCRDETSDFLSADVQDWFRADPVSLTDLRRALADMRARFANLARSEGS
ncbi:hypothetical protein B0675_01315 [Streptomyces sp. M41(2017)]|uniref:hypothetical protein n=1 Tax=Streptomyces sp. M41(2017) TaxID=1955065 RepID=UPI0009C15C1B|nr:hypothetical protein [Streptomyces sp. M41(2017)]OQQ15971.1 hypothetical protein B0675_01315 [Streptomyces sp. M41(2017)]